MHTKCWSENLKGRDHSEGLGVGRSVISEYVKVKLSVLSIEHHAMKAYWGVEVYLHALFDLGTRWR
jgi:predicted XRE-type DNA-binding protein